MSRVGSTGLTGSLDPSISSSPTRPSGSSASSGFSGLAALSGLSDRELLGRVKVLVSQERATTLEILVHLIEVERRKLHLRLGYPSLFEYCTRHLGYSSSAAGRRIHAARCIRNYPEVYGLLEKNEVTLITISLVASIMNESNRKNLLAQVRNKSQRQVELIVAGYRPPVAFRDRAKPVCVAIAEPAENKPVNSGPLCPLTPSAGSEISPNVAGGPPRPGTVKRALLAPGENAPPAQCDQSGVGDALGPHSTSSGSNAPSDKPTSRIERKLLIQFLASEAFMKKFEKARALLSAKLGKPSYEAVLETALDEFLTHHDPESRKQRREAGRSEANSKAMPKRPVGTRGESRHIPAATKDAVFKRDNGRCSYVGSTGKRCDATHNLQIDHIVPYARGGTNTVGNLRLLCSRHNKLEAERVYGATTISRFSARE